ncbi:MAG: sarcinarray family MAST domain-containing protein [Methanocella sp.]
MKPFYIILVLIVLLVIFSGEASGRSIKAYYNGQEATVTGVVLHPGEPFTVDLYMTPDSESIAYAEIDEPGVTRAYDLVEGDAIVPTDAKRCNASSPAHYRWVMAANDYWLEGTAPLNIYYQLNIVGSNNPTASGLFTVVEAYIAPGKATPGLSNTSTAGAPENVPSPGFFASVISVIIGAAAIGQMRKHRP